MCLCSMMEVDAVEACDSKGEDELQEACNNSENLADGNVSAADTCALHG